MPQEDKKIVVELNNGKKLFLKTLLFAGEDDEEETEVDLDKLLKIDIAHLAEEMVTFPVVLNMFGVLLADVTNSYNLAKLNLDIYEGKLKNNLYITEDDEDDAETGKAKKRFKRLTADQVDAKVNSDIQFQILKKKMYTKQKEMEYINSLFWSAKSKDEKLNKLSLTVKSGDIYDNLANSKLTRINNVDIKSVKPAK